ncbi:MAG: glycosyltransferase family 4 protein [Mariprofundus sp.]
MKILIVSQYFWPENFRINDLALELKGRGHEVTILTGLPNYPAGRWFNGFGYASCGRSEWQGISIIRVPMLRRMSGRGWQLALNYMSYAMAASLLGPILCRGRFDVVLAYEPSPFTVGIPAAMMRWLKGAPMMFWVQDLWPESLTAAGAVRSRYILKLVGSMVRWIYARCDRVLVQSEGFIKPAVAAGADPGRIRYFPNWAEDFYQPLVLPDDALEYAEMPVGFNIVFAGNMGEAQSLQTILEAVERLRDVPDIHWTMIGDGRRSSWMQEEAVKRGLDRIHFLGLRSPEQMPRYFSLADTLLATLRPDPVFSLTIPSKVQSYLACGRPIVAALDGEGARIIEAAGAGFAMPAGDAEGLADSILRLYNMKQTERDAMGCAARAYYDAHFKRKVLIDQLDKWIRKLVERRRYAS